MLRRLLNRLEFHLLYTLLSVYNRAWCLGWMRARCRRKWRVVGVGRPLVIGDSQTMFGFSRPAAGRLVRVG